MFWVVFKKALKTSSTSDLEGFWHQNAGFGVKKRRFWTRKSAILQISRGRQKVTLRAVCFFGPKKHCFYHNFQVFIEENGDFR